ARSGAQRLRGRDRSGDRCGRSRGDARPAPGDAPGTHAVEGRRMSRPISPNLVIEGEGAAAQIACRSCGHTLAPAGTPWKKHAVLNERSMRGAGGKAYTGAPE